MVTRGSSANVNSFLRVLLFPFGKDNAELRRGQSNIRFWCMLWIRRRSLEIALERVSLLENLNVHEVMCKPFDFGFTGIAATSSDLLRFDWWVARSPIT